MRKLIKEMWRRIFTRGRRGYCIAGKTYVQEPLVLGQYRQLIALLGQKSIPLNQGAVGLIFALSDTLPQALAICLTERNKSPKDKDVQELAAKIEDVFTAEMAIQAVEDFFVCNPLPSLLSRIAGLLNGLEGRMEKTGSSKSASSLPEATSDGETKSSGDTP